MQQVLSRLFRARPGEWGAVLLLQTLIFLIIGTLLIVKPTANALFLSEYGVVGLPYMYIATAVLAGLVSVGYSMSLRRYSLLRVSIVSLLLCALVLLGCAFFMRLPPARPAVAAALYLWTALFGVLAASQFWMMASFVFDVRQSKRLFGLVGAGAIAGGIAGGYVTNLLARDIGARNLILLAVALLIPCLVLTIAVWRRYVVRGRGQLSRQLTVEASMGDAPHRLILKSRHLMLLCGIVALGVTAAKLVDFQFSALAAERFGDQDRLAAFFGFWYSTFNIVALLIQLLLTNRIVQGVGVSGAMIFLPAGLGLGALYMLLLPGLSAATFSRAVDGSLKQSLTRASVEMLFLPLDESTKKRIKTYIDVFVDSLAGGVGGLLLIGLTQVAGVSAPSISWFVLALVTCWLLAIVFMREEYMEAFRSQLSHLRPRRKFNRLKSHHRQVMAGFLRVLEEGRMSAHEEQLLYVLDRTGEVSPKSFEEPIRQLLSHPSASVRSRALRSLYLQPGSHMVDEVRSLLRDENEQVRTAAFDYFFSRSGGVSKVELQTYLDDSDPKLAGPALLSIASETAGNARKRRQWRVAQRMRARIERLSELEGEDRRRWFYYLLQASGRSNTSSGRSFIQRSLLHEDRDIVRRAVVAAGESLHEDLLVPLLQRMNDPAVRPFVINALIQYQVGLLTVIPHLIATDRLSLTEVRRLPAVLERIDRKQTVDLLFAMIERWFPADLVLRMEVLRSLNTIRRDFPRRGLPAEAVYRQILQERNRLDRLQRELAIHQKLSARDDAAVNQEQRQTYIRLLEHRKAAAFERLFRLLGLRYPPADIIPVQISLNSESETVRANGLEFLDNLLELSLKRTVLPVLERLQQDYVPDSKDEERRTLHDLQKAEFRALRRTLRGKDVKLKLAAIKLIDALGEARFLPLLVHHTTAVVTEDEVRRCAFSALERLHEQLSIEQ